MAALSVTVVGHSGEGRTRRPGTQTLFARRAAIAPSQSRRVGAARNAATTDASRLA